MVEAAAEANEELMNKYLEDGELSDDEIMAGIRARTLRDEIVPDVLRLGVQEQGRAGDARRRHRATCRRRPIVRRSRASTTTSKEDTRDAGDDEPFSALAFKIMTDPFVGTLTFFRVYSGVLNSGDQVYNPVKAKKERIGRLLQMHANQREEIKEVRAGDIAAAVGLKDVTTGDTLCDAGQHHHARAMDLPGARHLDGGRAEDQGRPGKDGHRAAAAWRRKTRRSACAPTRSPARPSSPAWASCTWKSSSTA